MQQDGGATQTMVHPNLVRKAQYTGDSILVHLADGSPMECPRFVYTLVIVLSNSSEDQ